MSHAQACTNSKNRMAGEVKSSKPTGCECKLQMGEKEKGSKCKSSVKYRIDRTVKNEKWKRKNEYCYNALGIGFAT